MIVLTGFFISAPLGHAMLSILQKVFAGKTSARSKLAMIISSNLFISPIQQSVYSEYNRLSELNVAIHVLTNFD